MLARALVEAGWNRNRMAKDARSSRALHTDDPRAARFCLLGGVFRAAFELSISPLEDVVRVAVAALAAVLPPWCQGDLTLFSDHPYRKKADVLALFDAACERVGGK